jgi:hypothetical protein
MAGVCLVGVRSCLVSNVVAISALLILSHHKQKLRASDTLQDATVQQRQQGRQCKSVAEEEQRL